MNIKNAENALKKMGNDLFPSLGNMSDFNIYHEEQSIFSYTWKIRLHYGHATKNIVLKESHREPGPGSKDRRAVEAEYDILQILHDRFLKVKGINVVTPLACLPEDDILALEEFPGNKLNTVIVDHLRWLPSQRVKKEVEDYFTLCGQWLKLFQQFTREDTKVTFEKSLYLENIHSLLGALEKYGISGILQKKILGFIDAVFEKIGVRQLDLVGYHSDFTPWNVLVGDGEIAVMDFGQFSYSNSYDDLTLFVVTLEGYKSVVGMIGKNISHMRSAFLEGYDTRTIDSDIFDLLLLKNTLKSISMMGVSTNGNAGIIDRVYGDYRKRKQLGIHLRRLEQLTS